MLSLIVSSEHENVVYYNIFELKMFTILNAKL